MTHSVLSRICFSGVIGRGGCRLVFGLAWYISSIYIPYLGFYLPTLLSPYAFVICDIVSSIFHSFIQDLHGDGA
jgi:hypothetical protein